MAGWTRPVLNAALPGAGLLLAGRWGLGLGLLAPASLALATGLVLAVLFRGWSASLGTALAVYGALAVAAAGIDAWLAARARIDPAKVRALHRTACAAYLRGEHPAALAGARDLVRAAPEEAGAWRFLALVAEAAGDARLAARAARRAQAIEER